MLNPITDNAESIKQAIENTLSPLRTILDTLAGLFANIWKSINEMYDKHIKPMFDSFTAGISEITGSFLNGYNSYIAPVLDKLSGKFSDVWQETIEPLLDNFIGLIGDAADMVTAWWNNVLQPFINWIASNIMPVISPILESMGKLFLIDYSFLLYCI